MICLGIESTAHTFGIGIIKKDKDKKKILANVSSVYKTKKGGIIPVKAAEHHKKVKDKLVEQALKESHLSFKDINIVAFSQGPGLSPCLLQGMKKAKELALKYKKPLVGVNHCIAHLEIGRLVCKAEDPVLLYVSGANTQIISYASGKYRIFGETLDMGVGNFIDAFARFCGLGFPGGPKIEKLAKKGNFILLPYSVKGMDVSFSGLLTNLKQKYSKGYKLEDLSFSLQETAFAMLVETAERALAHLKKSELLLGGGVACNKRLQEMARKMCSARRAKFFCPPSEFLVDNGVMISWLGLLQRNQTVNWKNLDKIDIKPYERTDDVKVTWNYNHKL